jgi:hypothetical protein
MSTVTNRWSMNTHTITTSIMSTRTARTTGTASHIHTGIGTRTQFIHTLITRTSIIGTPIDQLRNWMNRGRRSTAIYLGREQPSSMA